MRLRKMDKLSLTCAFVGEKGSTFNVDVKVDKAWDEVKFKIKSKNQNKLKNVDTKDLRLFPAKAGGRAWLSSRSEDVKKLRKGEMTPLIEALTKEDEELLSEYLLEDLLKDMDPPSSCQVHVLVVAVPTTVVISPPVAPVASAAPVDPVAPVAVPPVLPVAAVLRGPEVNLNSCDSLLKFLEGEMKDKDVTMSSPHILEDASLQFRLVGREKEIKAATKCYNDIIAVHRTTASERTQQPIPVCSGVSGLGKTRMLEDGRNILTQVMELDPNQIASVIVPYSSGFSPRLVEQSMLIAASFSWRLLFRVFLDKNCPFSFPTWFNSCLSCNGGKLTLERAVEVVVRKLRQKMQAPELELLYLFLGVDDYQTGLVKPVDFFKTN